MKALYSNIMRLILTIGLSERDLFVDKVSKIISEKMDADPQRSEHIAESGSCSRRPATRNRPRRTTAS